MSSIASSKIFSKTNPPATAGIPPKIAAYHGIFSEIFNLNDKSKFNLSSSPCEFFLKVAYLAYFLIVNLFVQLNPHQFLLLEKYHL